MSNVQFTALIRVPFSRGDFSEPSQVSWDASKDRSLWKVVSKSSKASDLNWVELADNFDVPPTFLLQQAAWLYERHLNHVRAQLKKVGGGNASTPLGPDSAQIGGIPMKRLGSGGSGTSRIQSVLSGHPKEGPISSGESSAPAPPLSRTPSTNTITQSRALVQQPSIRAQPSQYRPTTEPGRIEQTANTSTVGNSRNSLDSSPLSIHSSSSSSSSPSDSDSGNPAKRSQLFKRPPRFRSQRPQKELLAFNEVVGEADDNGLSPATALPFAQTVTIRGTPRDDSSSKELSGKPAGGFFKLSTANTELQRDHLASVTMPSSSMTSSASDVPKAGLASPDPLSPRYRASLARSSPRGKTPRAGREGSEGAPSMGSSFSDIDDASISQSALEEALLSNMQHGRMSTLSQLRSRYL
ncbi:hypothetical protein CC80DRAFT_546060 [Byssothecium circinans]|uniref:Autophagy-related protein 29 n=1 Tax=Byssothecium circinans TaxID=147558 RepID=A0A6A5U344_9PLEO|nr:hypothetical protein CC80DRAFT_546060 [Byssothecium circinans]